MLAFTSLVAGILLHIPDGFLSLIISLLCWLATVVMLVVAVRKAQADYDERLIPVAGVMAAFIFAAQMLNFPVAGGTSGHLIGAALAFIVLGPWLGLLVMTAVIALQALLFQDGGLIVMGANILVMGIVPGFVGYGVYRLAVYRSKSLKLATAGVGAWLSIVAAALVTALLLAFSGTAKLSVVVPVMVGVHMLIGIGEALVTVAALAFIMRSRPALLDERAASAGGRWVLVGLGIALLVVLFAPYASPSPDGLEWVAGQQGFLETALDAPYHFLPDYTIPGLGETDLSTIVAGVVGVLVVTAVILLIGRFLKRPQRSQSGGY
ncbi:MAG: cobalamin biosynthesis protein CbiM [Chloroflexota bacterium]|nr:PDGLE domain-containing protein [Ardenticatenaceae bacterium]GIK57474.1 MAG: cobalamin biosynthesis protein CbiM [Chloroflexota bacterium]